MESLCSYFEVTEEEFISRKELILEIEKNNKLKENIKYHLPVIFVSFVLLLLTAVELFVFVREGIYAAAGNHYPDLSILTILKAYSLIPIGIYFLVLIFNVLFSINVLSINYKKRKLLIILSITLALLTYIFSFIISYSLVKPYNYGMFWKPH